MPDIARLSPWAARSIDVRAPHHGERPRLRQRRRPSHGTATAVASSPRPCRISGSAGTGGGVARLFASLRISVPNLALARHPVACGSDDRDCLSARKRARDDETATGVLAASRSRRSLPTSPSAWSPCAWISHMDRKQGEPKSRGIVIGWRGKRAWCCARKCRTGLAASRQRTTIGNPLGTMGAATMGVHPVLAPGGRGQGAQESIFARNR